MGECFIQCPHLCVLFPGKSCWSRSGRRRGLDVEHLLRQSCSRMKGCTVKTSLLTMWLHVCLVKSFKCSFSGIEIFIATHPLTLHRHTSTLSSTNLCIFLEQATLVANFNKGQSEIIWCTQVITLLVQIDQESWAFVFTVRQLFHVLLSWLVILTILALFSLYCTKVNYQQIVPM